MLSVLQEMGCCSAFGTPGPKSIYTILFFNLVQINLDPRDVIVTATGDNCDFVSRFFTPQASILEDPVTGSAHCSLIPYWSNILNKTLLEAHQVSERFGKLMCEDKGDRVIIHGKAKTYLEGHILIDE